jgi:hypothetical protein
VCGAFDPHPASHRLVSGEFGIAYHHTRLNGLRQPPSLGMEMALAVASIVTAVLTAAKTFEQIRLARKRRYPRIEIEIERAELELAKLFKSASKDINGHYHRARAFLGTSAVVDGG